MLQKLISVRLTCRVCNFGPLIPILSLGNLYVSDFIFDGAERTATKKFPLKLVLCNKKKGGCGLLQLQHSVSHESMYRQYWYRSGMNKTMTDELNSIANKVQSLVSLKKNDYVIDIGANDGTLLRGYKVSGLNRVGFEPAKNLMRHARVGTKKIINDFFSYPAWKRAMGDKKAKAVTAIAMFYDLENPNLFVSDVVKCLDPNGVFIIQMSYLPSMLSQNAFDNICHEHLEYYSLLSLEYLLEHNRLEVFDVEVNNINGGSFRIYIRHYGAKHINIPKGAANRVADMRVSEQKLGLDDRKIYDTFVRRVKKLRKTLKEFIAKEIKQGKKVFVYGASTKGNTLLQYYGLDHRVVTAAAERNPDKWGTKTVGTHIPIISEEEARVASPDYFLVLPWHFLNEFKVREEKFLKNGGKFIAPLPEFKII